MRETNKPTILAATDCHTHGVYDSKTGRYDVPWCGSLECHTCKRVFVCVETLTARTYPGVPDDGYCPCGSWLIPRTKEEAKAGQGSPVFSGRPICDACAKLRVAPAEAAKIEKQGMFYDLKMKWRQPSSARIKMILAAAALVAATIGATYLAMR